MGFPDRVDLPLWPERNMPLLRAIQNTFSWNRAYQEENIKPQARVTEIKKESDPTNPTPPQPPSHPTPTPHLQKNSRVSLPAYRWFTWYSAL